MKRVPLGFNITFRITTKQKNTSAMMINFIFSTYLLAQFEYIEQKKVEHELADTTN